MGEEFSFSPGITKTRMEVIKTAVAAFFSPDFQPVV